MKLQIKSHSMRFRITSEELQDLKASGKLLCETRVPQGAGETSVITYGVLYEPDASASELQTTPFGITLVLSSKDFAELIDPESEGVYIRRDYVGASGTSIRFLAYVEKDKTSKKHKDHKEKKHKKIAVSRGYNIDHNQPAQQEVTEL